MKTNIIFRDPYFSGSTTSETDGIRVTYPIAEKDSIRESADQVRRFSSDYFSNHSQQEILEKMDKLDEFFCDLKNPEIIELVDLTARTSGFSKYDIVKYGLGIFPLLVNYSRDLRGTYIARAMKTRHVIETFHGYLKRFGTINPFIRWKEPRLISHFISGNVVGYTSILSRIGLPVKTQGAAQILKLPSSSAFSPMIYLKKLQKMEPDLRKTIACGYWAGGDDSIERVIIEESDAINVLSSDAVIMDLNRRISLYHPGIAKLFHGHKVGIAYISREFCESSAKLEQVMAGLVCDISAFDGGACYNVKNIYVQGDAVKFAEKLIERLDEFAVKDSPVSSQAKPVGNDLHHIYLGSAGVLTADTRNAFVRVRQKAEFWLPDMLYRYVQVMPVSGETEVADIIGRYAKYLQTAIIAVPDEKILSVLEQFGKSGVSNIHYPGTAPLIHAYEEPHDGEFDMIKARFNYSARFAATNFRKNSDWCR
jgi:hypothetical protein